MQRAYLVVAPVVVLVGCAGKGDLNPDGDNLGPFTNGVSTLTGGATAGDVDGARGTARLSNPVTTAVGPDGRIYVADFDNGKIRVVDATSGETSTYVDQKGFYRPFALAFAG